MLRFEKSLVTLFCFLLYLPNLLAQLNPEQVRHYLDLTEKIKDTPFLSETPQLIDGQLITIKHWQEQIWDYQNLLKKNQIEKIFSEKRLMSPRDEKQYLYEINRLKNQLRELLLNGEITHIKPLKGGDGGGLHPSYTAYVVTRDQYNEKNIAVKVILKKKIEQLSPKTLSDRLSTNPLSEAQAYDWDQRLQNNKVPMVVLRKIEGREASLQVFVEGEHVQVAKKLDPNIFHLLNPEIRFFAYTSRHWDLCPEQFKNMGNLLYYRSYNILDSDKNRVDYFLIDFSYAFRTRDYLHNLTGKASWDIHFTKKKMRSYFSQEMIPQYILYKNLDFNFSEKEKELYPYLTRNQNRIEMLKKRRDLFVQATERFMKKNQIANEKELIIFLEDKK